MGVKELWNVIESSCDTISLDKLKDKTIAIDLAGWAVDSQCLGIVNAVQQNMYLRNLFCRTKALLLQGTIPVFVLEGKPPELKKKVIAERLNIRDGKSKDAEAKGSRCNRQGLNRYLKACEKMLNLMGLECVKAHGEAEAMCAYLNADGLVDGCITQDGDCFLYGAKTIYRKFTLSGKAGTGGTAEEYSIEKIEGMYELGRNKLIALALLCGCDYTPGVNQIGKMTALKFFSQFKDSEILRRMKSWRYDKSPAPTKEERAVKSKCILIDDFPNQEVIDEFLIRKGSIPTKIDNWKRPNGAALVEYLADNLNWDVESTFKNVLPIVTRWQVLNFMDIPQELRPNDPDILIPKEIKKTRKPGTVLSYEIEWTISQDSHYSLILPETDEPRKDSESLCTTECQHYVTKSYPELVQVYEELQAAKKKPPKRSKKPKTAEGEKKTEQPLKKTRGKKKESPNKRIDEFFQQRKFVPSGKPKKINLERTDQPETSGPQRLVELRENFKSKLDGNDSLNRMYDELCPEDFDRDVDVDCPDMSMVIERTCSQKNTILPTPQLQLSDTPSRDHSTDQETDPSPIKNGDVIDLTFDDDPIYIPLGERLKAKG